MDTIRYDFASIEGSRMDIAQSAARLNNALDELKSYLAPLVLRGRVRLLMPTRCSSKDGIAPRKILTRCLIVLVSLSGRVTTR